MVELLRQRDPRASVEAFTHLQLDLYWKQKNLPAVVTLSEAGINHALSHAAGSSDAALARRFRMAAKRLAYNLASFTWPGWNEPGITPTKLDLVAGLCAAELNVQLAEELHRPAQVQASALWTLGAQQLAAADYAKAIQTFERARAQARRGEDALQQRMLEGYALLAEHMATASDALLHERLQALVDALKKESSPDAVSYAEQLTTARDVFQTDVGLKSP